MYESTKAIARRLREPAFLATYFVGKGIDVGCGPDSLSNWLHLFPFITSVMDYDTPQGDAQYLGQLEDNTFDWLQASHVLEHMVNPQVALKNWLRVVKPGGYIVILVPDFQMYEKEQWPSRYNGDHKFIFTARAGFKGSVLKLLDSVPDVTVLKMELLHYTFDKKASPDVDQTLNNISECAIEIVLRKDK